MPSSDNTGTDKLDVSHSPDSSPVRHPSKVSQTPTATTKTVATTPGQSTVLGKRKGVYDQINDLANQDRVQCLKIID